MSISRRDFLKGSGALVVSFSAVSAVPRALAQGPFGAHPSHIDPTKMDSWIAVGGGGIVTAYTGKCDLGQGMFTAQTQLVAEELCVPLNRVRLIQCDTSICPDEGTTSGSQSTPFVHNVRVPGMLHGRVIRPPSVEASLTAVDENSVRQVPGLVKVVVRKNFVGVVAETQAQAIEAARTLKVTWKQGPNLPSQKTFYDTMRKQPSRDAIIVDSKDVEQRLANAGTALQATYAYPFQMHGSIGTSCAVADVKTNGATVWSPTQSVYPTRSIVAKLLGLPLDNVRVICVRGSGCYGLNGSDAVSFDAAILSQAVGRPVRAQLSRADEMAWENFGSAAVIEQRAAIENGKIVVWDCQTWLASKGGRPGYDQPGNVVTGTLLGYTPEPFVPRAAAEPTGELRNRVGMSKRYNLRRDSSNRNARQRERALLNS